MSNPVLHIVHNYSAHGGVQEHVRDLAAGLADHFDQFVLSPEGGFVTLFDGGGAVVRRYPGAELEWPVVPLHSAPHDDAVMTVLDELKPGLIHVHHLSGWPLGLLSLLRQSGIPWAITFHDYVAITPHGGMLGALEPEWTFTADYTTALYGSDLTDFCNARREFFNEALASASLRIAPSRYAADIVSRIYPGQYRVIEHGVRRIQAAPDSTVEGEPSISIDPRRLRFGYCGTMIPQKGWHLLFEAFVRVRQQMPEAELHFYGGVPDDPRFLTPQVFFHPPYERSTFPQILSSIDIGIIPSVFAETYCLVLSEYWQAGIPVAVSQIGALGERVSDGSGGRTFLPGDVEGIGNILEWFYRDRSWKEWELPVPRGLDQMLADYRSAYIGLIGSN